ncbi:MAG: competence/damage-inducible protein A [Atribacterota bacterium]|nr:competence/damage-inducible protein A [Atribacterota bacterium]MDD4896522.1 competence/damage-inducible protein A [Atribacterota bacterium]MDD5637902.1 competence/damage-inducible protein A [Atribacterota bacterium]
MNVEIISIGNEILCGNIIDTNANYIIKKLREINLNVQHVSAVGDDERELIAQLQESYQRSQIIITTGGLGPTEDDLTFQSIAKAFGIKLVRYPEAEKHMVEILNRINVTISPSNLKQAFLPEGSRCILNPYGTAPAMILEKEGRIIVALPGVPLEMKNLITEQIIPFLEKRFPNLQHMQSQIIRISGLGESTVNDKIKDFINRNHKLNIGIYASPEDIQIQLNALAKTPEETKKILDQASEQLKVLLGDYIFGYNQQSLEEVIGNLLRTRKLTLAVAESCTGGMLGEIITSVPGSSDYFKGGIISYDGELKEKLLDVSRDVMIQFGQVSEPVARAMAEGIRKKCNSDIGISVTGIAGPGGGSPGKPVGLVYIALADEKQTLVQKHQLHKDRQIIRLRSARRALNTLRVYLINYIQ